jgi:hypothetical protein
LDANNVWIGRGGDDELRIRRACCGVHNSVGVVNLERLVQCAVMRDVQRCQVLSVCCITAENNLKPTQLPYALSSDVTAGSNLEPVSGAEALGERRADKEYKDVWKHSGLLRTLGSMLTSADEGKSFFIPKKELGFRFNVAALIGLKVDIFRLCCMYIYEKIGGLKKEHFAWKKTRRARETNKDSEKVTPELKRTPYIDGVTL